MEKEKAFFLNLKKRIAKNGSTYYTGKFAYAIDIIAIEKKDGSGDLTCWLQPKDMDQMKALTQQQGAQGTTGPSRPYAPAPQSQAAVQAARPKVIPRSQPLTHDNNYAQKADEGLPSWMEESGWPENER